MHENRARSVSQVKEVKQLKIKTQGVHEIRYSNARYFLTDAQS